MARKTQGSKSTTKTQTTRRVESLEPKKGKQLSSLEEAVVRMHHGVSVKSSAKLPSNGVNDEVMAQLFEIEVKSHVESGRIDDLPEIPKKNAKTAKVVEKLKSKKR